MQPLTCTGLTKAYGAKRAVDGVSLALRRGDIYGLVGKNGAGKSTLLRMIAGYARPTAGTVEAFGERLAPGQVSERMGALIESPALNPGLTGAQNVMVRALALGLPDPRAATASALAAVGLDGAGGRVRAYSLGMRQRLGLALALVGNPDVLLLDEPFNGFDPEGVRATRRLLMSLAETRGVAILVSSHVLDQLERMATRFGILRDGRLVRELTADEVEAACADYLCVRSPEAARALVALEQALPGVRLTLMPDDAIRVDGSPDPDEVGRLLLAAGVPVSGLHPHARDVEELFVELMGEAPAASACVSERGGAGIERASDTPSAAGERAAVTRPPDPAAPSGALPGGGAGRGRGLSADFAGAPSSGDTAVTPVGREGGEGRA